MQDAILWIPFGLSLLVAVIAFVLIWKSRNQVMGMPTWEFSQSWASNISVIGGLVTGSALTFLSDEIKTHFLSRTGYAILLFVFPFLSTLAPLIYNLTRDIKTVSTPSGPAAIFEGRAYMFVLASVFTMWGSIGQLVLQALMFHELRQAELLESSLVGFLDWVLGFITLGVLWYGGNTIIKTVKVAGDMSEQGNSGCKGVIKTVSALEKQSFQGKAHQHKWTLL